ncbi:transmembrane protein 17-like [Galleria mellonella]|uniref:Transmembrane protein 17-like n=1 Tax=Galleria mellonella TaxID=7137 RepID=A0ABM3MH91_GALME|nr:transmembrane protein 17-like [Galleria mellonella]
MKFKLMLWLQKCLYLNVYLYTTWIFVVAFFLYTKLDILGHLTKYLSITVFTLIVVIEYARLYLGHYGNLSCRVPELAGFLMVTVLMQIPLVSFFLFNPYLLSTPTEIILHAVLWGLTLAEIVLSYLALKQASSLAKSIYLRQITQTGMTHHDAASVERAEPARREDCRCGRRGDGRRPFAGSVQRRSFSLPSWSNAHTLGVRMPADADRRVSVTIAFARQVRDWLSPPTRGKFEQCSKQM